MGPGPRSKADRNADRQISDAGLLESPAHADIRAGGVRLWHMDLIWNEDRVKGNAMERKRDGLLPIGEAFGGLSGLVKTVQEVSPQAHDHYRLRDQVLACIKK